MMVVVIFFDVTKGWGFTWLVLLIGFAVSGKLEEGANGVLFGSDI